MMATRNYPEIYSAYAQKMTQIAGCHHLAARKFTSFRFKLPNTRSFYKYSFKLCSTAYAAASARLLTPSLDKMLLT